MAQADSFKLRAQEGFVKGAAYDQHRPAYSATSVQVLLDNVGVSGKKGARILDLAAGTGKFTEALAAREEQFQIIAVEPHEKMRNVLAEKNLGRVTVMDGRADAIPLGDGEMDAVICAQSFHWFANKDSLREISRVLQRHGALGMIWNIDDYNSEQNYKPSTPWEIKAHDLLWTFDDNEPRYRHAKWRAVFDEQVKSSPLSLIAASDDEQLFSLPLGEHNEKFQVWLPKDQIWERFNTLSYIAVLEGEERQRTHKIFMDALNSPDVETDGDGNVPLNGTTITVWTTKIPIEGRDELIEVERPED